MHREDRLRRIERDTRTQIETKADAEGSGDAKILKFRGCCDPCPQPHGHWMVPESHTLPRDCSYLASWPAPVPFSPLAVPLLVQCRVRGRPDPRVEMEMKAGVGFRRNQGCPESL